VCSLRTPAHRARAERVDPSVAEREEQSQQKTAFPAYFSNVRRMFNDVGMRVRARSDLRRESVLGRVVWHGQARPWNCRRLRHCKQRLYKYW